MRRSTNSLTASLFACLVEGRRNAERATAQADSTSPSPSGPSKLTYVSSLEAECAAAVNRRKTHDQLEWNDVRMVIMSLSDTVV